MHTPMCIRKSSARVTEFPLRPIEPSAIISLIFPRWGIQGNQSAGYPEGTRKPARGYPKGKRKLLERQSPGNPKAPALMWFL